MTISQVQNMTDNTTMIIAIVFIAVITILVVIAAIASVLQKPTIKKPQNFTYETPSYKDQMVKFNFDESIRDLSEEITLSDAAQAVINTYNI